MSTTEFQAQDVLDIGVERNNDEYASVTFSIIAGNDTVSINVGRYLDDVTNLADELERALKQARDLVETWRDVPDEHDGFVFEGCRGYLVQLEGLSWNGSELLSSSKGHPRTFPTRDIATYELARAMADAGCFPNVWYQNERGYEDDINEDVRKYHDDGGDKMRLLAGVRYQPGTDVLVTLPGYDEPVNHHAQVITDYGTLGLVYVLSGDDEIRWTDDRDRITDDDESDDE